MTGRLHDVSTWPDGRLLDLAERRASYDDVDVASLAAYVLKSRGAQQDLPAVRELQTLRAAAAAAVDCGISSANPDTCGVCHKHFHDCEEDRFWYDDTPPMTLDKSNAACPGARVRAAIAVLAAALSKESSG